MSESWGFFERIIDKCPTIISIDLGIRDEIPMKDKAKLLLIIIDLIHAQNNGLPGNEEIYTLREVELELLSELEKNFNIIQVGRFAGLGLREFYYYIDSESDKLNETIANVLMQFPDYNYKTKVVDDPQWDFYSKEIYPNEIEYNEMSNEWVLQKLMQDGDTLETPRKVDYCVYFPNTESRLKFESKILEVGFKKEYEYIQEESELKYALVFSRIDSVDRESINKTTLELSHIAKDFEGKFEGWETQVIKKSLFKKIFGK